MTGCPGCGRSPPVDGQIAAGRPSVVACSGLKRRYRDLLVRGRPATRIAFLEIDRELAAGRLRARHGHFFDPALLDSQFADLEPPSQAETAVLPVTVAGPPDQIATRIIADLGLAS
jgi:gluconokinase